MTDTAPTERPEAVPVIDHPRLAEALEQVRDLDERPLAEHHARLTKVHEALHEVLHPDPASR